MARIAGGYSSRREGEVVYSRKGGEASQGRVQRRAMPLGGQTGRHTGKSQITGAKPDREPVLLPHFSSLP